MVFVLITYDRRVNESSDFISASLRGGRGF